VNESVGAVTSSCHTGHRGGPAIVTSHNYDTLFCLNQEEMVYQWLNPVYLKPGVQEQIREKFEADSEIELQGFLKVVE